MTGGKVLVTVNGETKTVAPDTSLADLIACVSKAETGVAVALNDEVVPRGTWQTHVLTDRDRVEILIAVQGG